MNVKGSAIVTLPKFVKEKFGDEGYAKWLDSLHPDAKKVYDSAIMVNNWYSLKDIMHEPLQKVCELFYDGRIQGAWDAGKFSADYALKGIYKIFVKFGSPDFIISRASKIIATYYQTGNMDVIERKKCGVTLHVKDFDYISDMIEARIGGWMISALEIHGFKEVKSSITKSLARGDKVTEYIVTWQE